MRVVIDHIAGSRRGQRQEFPASSRVRFGRHPDCEVSFDPHRDIDASSRHAELRVLDVPPASGTEPVAQGWVLVDLGSSNGTYVEGHRVTEIAGEPQRAASASSSDLGGRGFDCSSAMTPPSRRCRRRPSNVRARAGSSPSSWARWPLVVLGLILMQC